MMINRSANPRLIQPPRLDNLLMGYSFVMFCAQMTSRIQRNQSYFDFEDKKAVANVLKRFLPKNGSEKLQEA